ncbi:MAG: hypothetical protein AAB482_02340 [Patescibacteria group bacterium]
MKIMLALCTILAVIFALSSVGTTISYYQNIDTSIDNILSSTILNLGVSASDFSPPEIGAGESAQKTATVANLGGVDFQYDIEAKNFASDLSLCNALDLVASLDGKIVYTGKLNTFVVSATTTHYAWQYAVTLPSDVGNAACNFDLEFRAWQTDVGSYTASGYRDSEIIQNTISSRAIELPLIIHNHEEGEDEKGDGDKKDEDKDEQDDSDNHNTSEGHNEIIGESTTTPAIIEQEDSKEDKVGEQE